jgi:hypothetical protein
MCDTELEQYLYSYFGDILRNHDRQIGKSNSMPPPPVPTHPKSSEIVASTVTAVAPPVATTHQYSTRSTKKEKIEIAAK